VTAPPSVTWVIPHKLGGALAIVESLMAAAPEGSGEQRLVLTDNIRDVETRPVRPADARARVVTYELPIENLHAVLRRLRRAVAPGPGVLVSNDWLELAMEHAYPSGRAVVQLLHGDHAYYYDLAARHDAVIDCFIAYSAAMAEGLRARLPHRGADIVDLPYGVRLPLGPRRASVGPLRVVFAGRLEHEQKGVLDLPAVAASIAARGVAVDWTVAGDGPEATALRAAWPSSVPCAWLGPLAHDAMLKQWPSFDVFVLPTRGEGFPVALVEAMGAGLVPVVSDIRSGVPEIVTHDTTGLLVAVGDIRAMAHAVVALASDRPRLERLSAAAASTVAERFDPVRNARAYFTCFDALASTARRPRPASPVPYGSRLDRAWLPNALVRRVRAWRRP
jgi:glycosyltransferase involved in cell wall biosynthesis